MTEPTGAPKMAEGIVEGSAEAIHGVVVIDKPIGMTSFAVVRQARRATGAKKVGHGGTLDPLASGVLPICFGEATKLAQFLLDADKEYEAAIRFGVETDTHDSAGVATARGPVDDLTETRVRDALARFVGPQQQVPPIYSALKRAGRPLYAYARAGETVEITPRPIRIDAIELRAFGPAAASTDGSTSATEAHGPVATIFVRCSKGTYVRALARDIGRALGTVAHLAALRRTRSGPFTLDDAIPVDRLGDAELPLIAPATALRHLPSITVSSEVAVTLVCGQVISWQAAVGATGVVPAGAAPIRILDAQGALVAVAHPAGAAERVRTLRVFNRSEIG
jgi:tRNA pseudouridine55 synthase